MTKTLLNLFMILGLTCCCQHCKNCSYCCGKNNCTEQANSLSDYAEKHL